MERGDVNMGYIRAQEPHDKQLIKYLLRGGKKEGAVSELHRKYPLDCTCTFVCTFTILLTVME